MCLFETLLWSFDSTRLNTIKTSEKLVFIVFVAGSGIESQVTNYNCSLCSSVRQG